MALAESTDLKAESNGGGCNLPKQPPAKLVNGGGGQREWQGAQGQQKQDGVELM